jgi:hypothetical protein
MLGRVVVGGVLFFLAACNAGADGPLQPGRWEVKSEILRVDTPQPDDLDRVSVGQKATRLVCINAAQAREPYLDLLIPWTTEGARCQARLSMRDGRIEASTECSLENPAGRYAGTFRGRYEPQSYNLQGHSEFSPAAFPNEPRARHIVDTRFAGRRLGECTGGEESPPPRPS